jgi:hypothetical protein
VLAEPRDRQTFVEQRRHDLPETVVPAVRHGVGELDVGRDVGARLVEDQRLRRLHGGVAHDQRTTSLRRPGSAANVANA